MNYSDEEKEAIKQLKSWRDYIIKNKDKVNKANDIEFYLRTVLNLIQKQEKENTVLRQGLEENTKEIEELKEQYKEVVCIPEGTCFMLEPKDADKNWEDKIKEKIEKKFLEAKGLYERGVLPAAQYTMKLLRDLENSLLEKE